MEEIISLTSAILASLSGGDPYPTIVDQGSFLGYYFTIEEIEDPFEEDYWYPIPQEMYSDFSASGRSVRRTRLRPGQYFCEALATQEHGEVVGIRPIYKTFETLKFLVSELEAEADHYAYEASQTIDPNTNEPIDVGLGTEIKKKNAVLGYLRATNHEYAPGVSYYGGLSELVDVFLEVCGPLNHDYDARIANSCRHLFRFPDFFGRLVAKGRYFSSECGAVTDADNIASSDWEFTIADPGEELIEVYDADSHQYTTAIRNIDFPHLVAVIDGNYVNTGQGVFFGRLPDVVSWAGDMQTAYMDDDLSPYLYLSGSVNQFKGLLNDSNLNVSDFLTDVDGVNIGVRQMSYMNKRLSTALESYYSPKSDFARFRYDQFPGNALYYETSGQNLDLWERFELKVKWDMRLERDPDGNYNDVVWEFPNLEQYLVRDDLSSNADKREHFADCFLDYIMEKSIYGLGGC